MSLYRLNHFFGGVLLISGTAIGAGMLAIPTATAYAGFFPSLLTLAFCWLFMLLTAFLFLEVNLHLKGEVNLVSMAGKTLGVYGKVISWTAYLLLLYCLTAAYISGSSPIFAWAIEGLTGIQLSPEITPFIILFIFGGFIYLGTRSVDMINRIFILGLVITYFSLVMYVPAHIDFNLFKHVDMDIWIVGIPIVITSYGFHIIIPSLTTYMNHNKKKLRLAVLIGSSIPFFVYVLWEFLILGTVPLNGALSIHAARANDLSVSAVLSGILHSSWISIGAQLFSLFAIVTSFLGVSLSLTDFLTDGLKIKKTAKGRVTAMLLTFLPPIIFVFVFEHGFSLALQYAAVFVAILLGILPALMAWTLPKPSFWSTLWGKVILATVIMISCFVIYIDILEQTGRFDALTEKYDSH